MPSTYNTGVSVTLAPMFTPGVVSSVVGAVLVDPVTEPTSSLYVNAAVEIVGAVVSTVTLNVGLGELVLPAASVNVYVNACEPGAKTPVGVNVPVPESYVDATEVPST